MRIGKYEASDSANAAGTAVTFLLIGLGAGALLGMLLAPKPGKQMRKDLRRKFDTARETVDDWTDDAKEFAEEAMERGAEIADEVRGTSRPTGKSHAPVKSGRQTSDLRLQTSDFRLLTSDVRLALAVWPVVRAPAGRMPRVRRSGWSSALALHCKHDS